MALLSVWELGYCPAGGSGVDIINIKELLLEAGSVVAVLGRNGCGKSTFLRRLSGRLRGRGSVSVDGVEMDDKARLSAGPELFYHLEQSPAQNIFTNLSVEENISLATFSRNGSSGQFERAWELVVRNFPGVGCADGVLTRDLSGGEQQGLGLLLCTLCNPRVILLDEYTASLDEENKVACAEYVYRHLRRKDRVVVWVTQDIGLVEEFSDGFLVLSRGEVVGNGVRDSKKYSYSDIVDLAFHE